MIRKSTTYDIEDRRLRTFNRKRQTDLRRMMLVQLTGVFRTDDYRPENGSLLLLPFFFFF